MTLKIQQIPQQAPTHIESRHEHRQQAIRTAKTPRPLREHRHAVFPIDINDLHRIVREHLAQHRLDGAVY